jgi:hypothetical protein
MALHATGYSTLYIGKGIEQDGNTRGGSAGFYAHEPILTGGKPLEEVLHQFAVVAFF